MLKIRVIPTLLWKDFGLVKGVGFNSWRRVGSVLPAIKVYNSRDVDELILVDISATNEARKPDGDSVADFSRECFVPFTVGGGIDNINQISTLLHSGADKICINTAAYDRPALIQEGAKRFGSQCIVASMDVSRCDNNKPLCFSHAGKVNTGRDPVSWAKELVDLGVGEILLTSIDHDGTMSGYDLNLIEDVVRAVNVPVIASGGAGKYQDMIDAVNNAGASAVAAASMFHFTEQTPAGAKQAMALAGINVRKNLTGLL
ncbi:imidazole glycerol phosphate synthase subunit HisF [Polynucleobacter sp. UB-Tiil-W10]|uniref:imidazole glycerol phosphate synthase subunit HisF n=1 Tax=Polynucleobacter sp. UB-Tiil-W10 TaxID=1855648 RepID=UPI001C0CAD2A|nr:imidazole glycerol phosphate synthase cyclase subunit [Polynucleobacter sp. UB-Tiil-W10]MBU3540799.1 imidazole glycerol phosphate synthase subunit HisF [Polynucleobacter sp. UB-Tiil-W10]